MRRIDGAGQWRLRRWPGAPRRVGAVGAARSARSATGYGAAQRRRLIKYGSIRQRSAAPSSGWTTKTRATAIWSPRHARTWTLRWSGHATSGERCSAWPRWQALRKPPLGAHADGIGGHLREPPRTPADFVRGKRLTRLLLCAGAQRRLLAALVTRPTAAPTFKTKAPRPQSSQRMRSRQRQRWRSQRSSHRRRRSPSWSGASRLAAGGLRFPGGWL